MFEIYAYAKNAERQPEWRAIKNMFRQRKKRVVYMQTYMYTGCSGSSYTKTIVCKMKNKRIRAVIFLLNEFHIMNFHVQCQKSRPSSWFHFQIHSNGATSQQR